MTASELQRRVKAALETIAAPVSKDYREYDGTFPNLVYSEISNVPAYYGDNRELFFAPCIKSLSSLIMMTMRSLNQLLKT